MTVQMQSTDPGTQASVIALVDDEAEITRVLEAWLSFNGVEASVHGRAETLIDGLAMHRGRLAVESPDGTRAWLQAVVVDLNLPGMSGADLVARLRALQPDLRIVMITAALDNNVREHAQTLLDVPILAKPFSFHALGKALLIA